MTENKSVSRYMPKVDCPDTFLKISKKPIVPSKKEIMENSPSRSAKLRYVIKKKDFYEIDTDIMEKFNYLIEIENLGNKL